MKFIILVCFALFCFAQAHRRDFLSTQNESEKIIISEVSDEDNEAIDHAARIIMGKGTPEEMNEFIDYMSVDDEDFTSAQKIRGLLHNQALKKRVVSALGSYVKH